ncbi:extracellular solute-binding protein [Planctomycetota bacterium]
MRVLQGVLAILILSICIFCTGCGGEEADKNVVVVYTALDKIFSEPILKQFEEQTGIIVKAVYDVESSKTVGLRNRIISEKANPVCDVFWNNEIIHTIKLKHMGLLQPYVSANAESIPEIYKDREGYWCGFAARGRIIIYNTDKIKGNSIPKSLHSLTDSKWKNNIGLALPLFGTTSTHMAVLYTKWGPEKLTAFFKKIQANQVRILDGNATCMRRVAAGEIIAGFTDTDDANLAILDGKHVSITIPDQGDDGMGFLVIPNTVSMIKGAAHSENAKKLIDFLLSPEVEVQLSNSPSGQIPLHKGVTGGPTTVDLNKCKLMQVDFDKAAKSTDAAAKLVEEYFVR